MRELRLDSFVAALAEEGRVVLVQRDGVLLLLEGVLADAIGGVREGFLVEGLQGGVGVEGAFEVGDAGLGGGEGGGELGGCWGLVWVVGCTYTSLAEGFWGRGIEMDCGRRRNHSYPLHLHLAVHLPWLLVMFLHSALPSALPCSALLAAVTTLLYFAVTILIGSPCSASRSAYLSSGLLKA